MRKGIFIFVLTTVVLGWVNLAEAQQGGEVYRIGWLSGFDSPATDPGQIPFRQGLGELGYVEGQNLVIEYRYHKRDKVGQRLSDRAQLAAELVRLKVDVIVTSPGRPEIRAAQQATRTIPIVMTGSVVDPVEAGFVESLARPGGNITGLTNLQTDLHPKRLELLKEAFPRISRVAILWPEPVMKEIQAVGQVGQALGIQIQSLDVRGRYGLEGLESAFSAIRKEGADALFVDQSYLMIIHRARVVEFAAKRRLPAIYAGSQYADAGGLMFYGPNTGELYRQSAAYVDKILKGAKPGDLPVRRATKIELIINLKTAKKLGFTFSPQFLARADKVIK